MTPQDPRDKIIAQLMDKIINPPIFVHPMNKLADDLGVYIRNTKRLTKSGLRRVMEGR